ncbi:MAG TPA: tyrosine-type recombinase/integrase [Herpetosiphonaceae bacterium]
MALITGPLVRQLVFDFLTDLATRERSLSTRRSYGSDLGLLVRFLGEDTATSAELTIPQLRAFLRSKHYFSATRRARLQAALTSLCQWATQHSHLASNPMAVLTQARVAAPAVRSRPHREIDVILAIIPHSQRQDRLLFGLMFALGLRVSEVLRLAIEDIDLTHGQERLRVVGTGKRSRTVLLDDPRLITQLRAYLTHTGAHHGRLFRAVAGSADAPRVIPRPLGAQVARPSRSVPNRDGGPLHAAAIHQRWLHYCAAAGIACTLRQLREGHATELGEGGVR